MTTSESVKLTCDCCGYSDIFDDGEAAFRTGWDAEPYFSQYTACHLCPGSFVMLNKLELHIPAHERWQRDGRPHDFMESMVLGDVPLP